MRLALLLIAALGAGLYLRDYSVPQSGASLDAAAGQPTLAEDAAKLAYEGRSSGRIIAVTGMVERILTDDRDGSAHQRFIIRTPRGVSLLISHNLDLAPRLEGIRPGDSVAALGEYEWNEKGGVMHWTHKDPQGQHRPGYIEWRGRRYQ